MRRSMLPLLAAAIASCARPPAPPSPHEVYELGPMAPLAWLLIDARSDSGSWHWVAAGDKVYGVAFDRRAYRQGFQVMIIEDERDPGRTKGEMWLQMYDGPESLLGIRSYLGDRRVRFREGMPEAAPFEVTLTRDPDGFHVGTRRTTAQRTLGPSEDWQFEPYEGSGASEVEEAERALLAAVNGRGQATASTSGEVWAASFAPDGAYWCERCMAGAPGRAAEAGLAPRNNPGRFEWVPIASRRAGDLGFTVGHISFRPRLLPGVWRGTYVTVWRRGADGRWSVVFYTRRAAVAALNEPE